MCEVNTYKIDDLKILTNQYSVSQIKEAYNNIRYNFMRIYRMEDYLQFDLDTLKNILKSDDLNVDDEEIVLKTIKNWLIHKKMSPEKHLHLLLDVVRLHLLPLENLWSQIEEFGNTDVESLPLLLEALHYHIFPKKKSSTHSEKFKGRKIFRKLLSVGSWEMTTCGIIELYDASIDKWTHLKTYDLKRRDFAVAIIDNFLMIMGGNSGAVTDVVDLIDLRTGQLTSGTPMNEKRWNFNAVVVKSESISILFVVGGSSKALNSVEKWNPITKEWSYVAPMIVPRDGCGCALFDGKIYAAGGRSGATLHSSMEMYDIKNNRWEMKASMADVRPYCRIVASKSHIYAIGGHGANFPHNPISKVEKYDPFTNSWMIVASINTSGLGGLYALGNRIVSVGGAKYSKTVQAYDIDKDEWSYLTSLNHGRDGPGIVELPQEMYHCKIEWI